MKKLLFFIFTLLFPLLSFAQKVNNTDWYKKTNPTNITSTTAYGSYSAGCIAGAQKISPISNNYELVRPERKRLYAHTVMLNFIDSFSKEIKNITGNKLFISDLGQARGGPAKPGSSHQSHQTGLDVDIWFDKKTDKKGIIQPVSMLKDNKKSFAKKNWHNNFTITLKIAAEYDNVDRIFVNPYIKKYLCTTNKSEKWLNKIRPWWGHYEHYHVRLACPESDSLCKSQFAVKDNDGCDDSLEWWFSKEALESKKVKKVFDPILPEECLKVFNS